MKNRSKCTSSSGCTIRVLAGGAGALRIRALAHAWQGGKTVSGQKRKVLGNVLASALRAWQPAVGMRACQRIFFCRSSCLRSLSVCELLLLMGTVSAAGASSEGVRVVVVTNFSGGKSSRASCSVSQCQLLLPQSGVSQCPLQRTVATADSTVETQPQSDENRTHPHPHHTPLVNGIQHLCARN